MKNCWKIIFIIIQLKVSVGYCQNNKTQASKNPYASIDKVMATKNDSLKSIEAIANFINSKYSKEEDKARAIYFWISQNIAYSVDLMYTYTTDNKKSQLVKDAFENRKAVCIGYASLYDTLCILTHLQSFIVHGSTKEDFLPSTLGHAWNALKINNQWKLVDPTWGSGYLSGKKFIRSQNNFYFFTPPEKLIKTHLPFDPIWQLLNYPITLYQFHSQLPSNEKNSWNYTDSITEYFNSTHIEQIIATARRLNTFGSNSEITLNHYVYLQSEQSSYYYAQFQKGFHESELAVKEYNDYIQFKNNQFTPVRSDADIALILPSISSHLDNADKIYFAVADKVNDAEFKNTIQSNIKHSADLRENVKTETIFIDKYLSTKKSRRRDLFYTKTYYLYGIPVKK